MVYTLFSVFFSLQNAVCFIILTYLVPVLFTFYIQVVLKLKKNNSGAKRLETDLKDRRIYVKFCFLLAGTAMQTQEMFKKHFARITTGRTLNSFLDSSV